MRDGVVLGRRVHYTEYVILYGMRDFAVKRIERDHDY